MDDKSIFTVISKIRNFLALCALAVVLVFLLFKNILLQTFESTTLIIVVVIALLFFLGVLILAYKDANRSGAGNKEEEKLESGYKILSKLLIFRYSDFKKDKEDELYELNILKVENLYFSESGDFEVESRHYDKDKIQSLVSVSDPITSSSTVSESLSHSKTTTKYTDIKKGDIKISVNETMRSQNTRGILSKVDDVEVMYGHGSKIIKKDDDTFASTSIPVKTENLRLLLYFPEGKLPKDLEVFQINQNGVIRNSSMSKAVHHSKHLWVIDCYEPLIGFQFYAYWNWKNVCAD